MVFTKVIHQEPVSD